MPDTTLPGTSKDPEHVRSMHYGPLIVKNMQTGCHDTVDVDVMINTRKLGIEQYVQHMAKQGRDRQGLMGGAIVIIARKQPAVTVTTTVTTTETTTENA